LGQIGGIDEKFHRDEVRLSLNSVLGF